MAPYDTYSACVLGNDFDEYPLQSQLPIPYIPDGHCGFIVVLLAITTVLDILCMVAAVSAVRCFRANI